MDNRDKIWILAMVIGTPLLYFLNNKGIINISSKMTEKNAARRMKISLLTSMLPILIYFIIPDSINIVIKVAIIFIVVIICMAIQIYSMSKK